MEPCRLDHQTWLYRGIPDRADARRVLVGRHLAEALGVDVDAIPLTNDASGRPQPVGGARPRWFGTAGRDGVLVIGLSTDGPVGVDVESLHHCRDWRPVAASLFTPDELHWLDSQAEDTRPLAFGRLWTAKEAVLKAAGQGIIAGLAQPELSHLDKGPPPWPPTIARMDGAPYSVAWYTSMIDDAQVIAARATPTAGTPSGAA